MHWDSTWRVHPVAYSLSQSGNIFFKYPKSPSWTLHVQAESRVWRPTSGMRLHVWNTDLMTLSELFNLSVNEVGENGLIITKDYYRIQCTGSHKALRVGPGLWNRSVSTHCHFWLVDAGCWEVWGLPHEPLCPVPRCVSDHAFFYTGERCQAMQVHGSILGLVIGGTAGVLFLTFTIISVRSKKSRQWPACWHQPDRRSSSSTHTSARVLSAVWGGFCQPCFEQASEDQGLQPPVWPVWIFCPQTSDSVTLLCALNVSTVSVTALTALLCKSLV